MEIDKTKKKATRREPDPAFLALLRAVADLPNDDTPILATADWLDEHSPPESIPAVYSGRFPGWFTKAWRVNVPAPFPGPRFIWQEVTTIFDYSKVLDHGGFGWVCGLPCLVSEPYLHVEHLAETIVLLREMAACCSGVGVFSRESNWNPPRTWRLIWAPHPDRVPSLNRSDRMVRHG